MPDLFFEDFRVGATLPEASIPVAAEDVAYYADRFAAGTADRAALDDGAPPPLSGFHVAALGMRLLFEAFLERTAALGAPGIDEVTWPHPVWPGDTLHFTARVWAARLSASRPEMGLVTVAIALFNQSRACVMTQSNAIMVARRSAAPRPDAAARGAGRE